MKRKKILIFRGHINMPNAILTKILNKMYDVDNIVVYNKRNFIKALFYIIKNRKKYNKVIIVSGPVSYAWFFSKLIPKKSEFILFVYDFNFFRQTPKNIKQKIFHRIRLFCEKQLLLKADKIIHKGLENELEFLPFYDKIKNKPHHLFREFLDKDLIQKYDPNIKLSKKDGEIHLVYGGIIHATNDFYHEKTVNLFKRIVKEKIHLHVYGKPDHEIENLDKNNPYFHYEGFVPHTKLVKEYTKYDYGIYLYGRLDNKFGGNGKNIWDKTGFSNKIYDYIEAKLPIIYSKNMKAVSNLLESSGFSIGIKYNDVDKLKKMLEELNRNKCKKLIEKMDKFIEKHRKNENLIKFLMY